MARKQWRCFHCDEVFISFKCAASHFGTDETKTAACQLKGYERHLVDRIRDLEEQLIAIAPKTATSSAQSIRWKRITGGPCNALRR